MALAEMSNAPHPVDAAMLQLLIARATPKDGGRGMYFNAALEVIRTCGGEAALQTCRAELGVKRYIDIFTYPMAEFLRIIGFIAQRFESAAAAPVESAFRRVGIEAARTFLASATGKTLALIAGRNLRQVLASTPAAYSAMVTYGERKVTWRGERHACVAFREDFLAGCYHEVIMKHVYSSILGAPVRVMSRQLSAFESDCDVSW